MSQTIWIRAESKTGERRAPVVPKDAGALVAAGFSITVEKCERRAFADADYQRHGCQLVENNSWPSAPDDAIVLGLKELAAGREPLTHRHIHFGHVFKGQAGWREMLQRFADGGGTLLDLECLVDDNGRRIAAFGYWAGFAGAALAVKIWAGQRTNPQATLGPVGDYGSKDALIGELAQELSGLAGKPNLLVVGALGRCGKGASDLAADLGLTVTAWDMAETATGGPFPEILSHDIFVNAVLAAPGCPIFVPKSAIGDPARVLSVIADVSCDPTSAYNPIPIYDRATSFADPVIRVAPAPQILDVMAIDHLPSLLPVEASTDYSAQLLPALLELGSPGSRIWGRAGDVFNQAMAKFN